MGPTSKGRERKEEGRGRRREEEGKGRGGEGRGKVAPLFLKFLEPPLCCATSCTTNLQQSRIVDCGHDKQLTFKDTHTELTLATVQRWENHNADLHIQHEFQKHIISSNNR